MILRIEFPFDNLPDVVFEMIERIQSLNGDTIISARSTQIADAKSWVRRMLTCHRPQEQVDKIFGKIQWSLSDAA